MNKKLSVLVLACFIATCVASAKQTQTFQQYAGSTNNFTSQQIQSGYYGYTEPTAFQNYTQNGMALPPIQVPIEQKYSTNLTTPQVSTNEAYTPDTYQPDNYNSNVYNPSTYDTNTYNVSSTQTASYYDTPQTAQNGTLQGKVVMIPASAVIPAVTSMEYSSENTVLGQSVSFNLPNGFYYNGIEVAPAGSVVQGTVIQVQKAGHATRNAALQMKFTSILTPYGQNIPISGSIKTDDGTGVIRGGTKFDTTKEYTKDLAVGAGSGAVFGTVMGALSGGKVGKGAVYGTAVGAGLGLAKSLWDKGGSVVIPANSCVDIVLEQPVTYSPIQNK